MVRFQYPSAVILIAACSVSAQQWTAIRLHPEGAQFSAVYAVGAGQHGGFLRDLASLSDLPVMWRGTSTSWMALASGTGIAGDVLGIWGGVQVGDVSGHAALWLGTPQSQVGLQPPGAFFSSALAVRGAMQTGTVIYPSNENHAALWRGTAASFVDLHPAGAVRSFAYATDGVLQGGSVDWQAQFVVTHATIWNGSVQSFVDLSPNGRTSDVYGMAPGIQVGDAYFPGSGYHAAVWHGTAQSFVDFNVPLVGSRLFATTGMVHVGQGGISGPAHAILNFGTPGAWLDLHQFLPPGYNSFSAANAVYQDGGAISVGGYAVSDATGDNEAFLWIGAAPCYANCDQSTTAPIMNVSDFFCFLNRFGAGDGYANCDGSTRAPVLNVLDFLCFLNRFAAGCS